MLARAAVSQILTDEIAGVFSGTAMSLNALATSFTVPPALTLQMR
jgi:putative effector of murein hydrolase